MPLYEFDGASGIGPPVSGLIPRDTEVLGQETIPGVSQLSEVQGGRVSVGNPIGTLPGYTQEFLVPGFKSLDAAMRRYWSGIRVPTKDSYRFLRVKVAGGDRSLMVWNDELKGGRARLPVAAIDRTGWKFNPEKWSPSTHPMAVRYPSRRGDMAVKVFRPVPFTVEYTMAIWTERKRDADFIAYQVSTRFNPLAEFRMFDGHLQGTVTMSGGDFQDSSDKEAGADQHANVRYEVSMTAEAWLPLPEQVVKTVLGKVSTISERLGEVLLANVGAGRYYEPVH